MRKRMAFALIITMLLLGGCSLQKGEQQTASQTQQEDVTTLQWLSLIHI